MRKLRFLFLGLLLAPSLTSANVVINEIAWMGTVGNQYGEWIELYNNGNEEIDLNNWKLYKEKDGNNTLIFTLTKKITSADYLIIERTTDSSPDPLPNINDESGKFGGGSLVNLPGGEHLILKNAEDNIVEDLDFSTDGWSTGDNITKQTMQLSSSGWITATATPKAANAVISVPPEQQSQEPQAQSSGGGSSYIPPEDFPQIKAYAGKDRTVTVGANVEFRGQAFGLEDGPLDNARFLWTFGDGATKEGQNITHFYQYLGEYVVVLNISSGEYSASDTILIKAVPNQVFISEIKTGADSFIEIENRSKEEIDISGCQIKYGDLLAGEAGQIFIFPSSTRIRPNTYLVVSSSVSGMIFYPGKRKVELLYPGGFKADEFNYDGFLSESESFNRKDDLSFIGSKTPGAKNIISSANSKSVPLSENKNIIPNAESPKPISENNIEQKNDKGNIFQENNNQPANIVTVGNSGNTKSNTRIYLFVIAGLIIFSGGAILFIRRNRGV